LRKVAVAGIAVCAFAVAGAAQAANWQVAVGEQGRPPAGTPKQATLDAFYPVKLVVNAGDNVTFSSATFHTATYLGKAKPPPLFMPDPAKTKYEGINDSTGQPFYFNGLPKFIYNGAAFGPMGGTTVDGTATVSSGILSPKTPKSPPAKATFTFPKAGTYRIVCNIHPGMLMNVVVKPAGSPVPLTPTQVKAQTLVDISGAWEKIKGEDATAKPPANTVYAGIGKGPTTLAFYPKVLTVKTGTTVKFVNKAPNEVHNEGFVTKAGQKWTEKFVSQVDLLPQGPNSPNQVGPYFVYGTEPKGKYQYDGTNHGNGFLATPLTAGFPAPIPKVFSVTFTKPGTYHYICLIHGPDMSGNIVVTP
jgi:plastocyanin